MLPLKGHPLKKGQKRRTKQPQKWQRGLDSNQRPLGYEPNELPGCSTPRRQKIEHAKYDDKSVLIFVNKISKLSTGQHVYFFKSSFLKEKGTFVAKKDRQNSEFARLIDWKIYPWIGYYQGTDPSINIAISYQHLKIKRLKIRILFYNIAIWYLDLIIY